MTRTFIDYGLLKLLVAVFFTLSIVSCNTKNTTTNKSSANPRINFYQWVNKDWMERTEIPADKPGVNNFSLISDKVNQDIEDLLISLKEKPDLSESQKKISLLFNAYMNMDKRTALGLLPLKKDLENIDNAEKLSDITLLFAQLQLIGVPGPIVYTVETDFKQSDRSIVYILQHGLGLEKDNYTGDDERSKTIRGQYQQLLTRLFELASVDNAANKATNVLALETELAKHQWSKVENRNFEKMYNLTDYQGAKTRLSHFNFDRQLKALGMPTKYPFNVTQPSYVEFINDFIGEQDIQIWKDYLKARLLITYSKYLDHNFKKTIVDYEIARGLYDKEEPLARQAVIYLNTANENTVGMILGRIYVEEYFNEGIKAKLTEIINNIVAEYRVAINASKRMSAQTKAKAIEKLDKMKFKIGYPDKWLDYSALEIVPDNLAQNHKNISTFSTQWNIAKLGKPVDENEWGHPPQVVNASYNPTQNTFVLLAAILNPPFFDMNASDAEHYGSIGFVVGHEIGHGFDDQGGRFDATGNMVNWWSEEDAKAYNKVKDRLIAAASKYEIMPGKFLNGSLEVGEIMGDASGSEIALRSYQKILKSKNLDQKQGYTDFFKQLAKTWRAKYREQILLMLLEKDPHPPSEYRANGIVANFDEFHEAFNTKPGDAMYLAPENRIRIW